MKHRAFALKTAGTWLLLAFSWGACGGAQDGPEEPDGQLVQSPANAVGTWAGVQPTAYPTAASTPYVPPPVPPPPPPSEQECRARASRTAPYDVNGLTDVKAQLGRFFDAQHETFRCCFDALEGPSRPGFNAKVSMVFRIEADGKFSGVEAGPGGDTLSPATNKCLAEVSGMLSYPAPIGGKAVAYGRIFDFKAHR